MNCLTGVRISSGPMTGQEAIGVTMEALTRTDIRFETFVPCEIAECLDHTGKRFNTPMGMRCTWCLGKILESALGNKGRLWNCHCNTNAAPCVEYHPKDLIRSKTHFRFQKDGSVKPHGKYGVSLEGPCDFMPCHHLPGCHTDKVRLGMAVSEWYARVAKAA